MKQTIALIDDDRNILTSISIALEKEGYNVQTYLDGESALIGLSRTPPDLAIIDIKMPKMDGEELLKKLRKKTSMPVIFFTWISLITSRTPSGCQAKSIASSDILSLGTCPARSTRPSYICRLTKLYSSNPALSHKSLICIRIPASLIDPLTPRSSDAATPTVAPVLITTPVAVQAVMRVKDINKIV